MPIHLVDFDSNMYNVILTVIKNTELKLKLQKV